MLGGACAKSNNAGPDKLASLAGTWLFCRTDDNGTAGDPSDDYDVRQTLVFSGINMTLDAGIYTSSDGSCSGTQTVGLVNSGTIALGQGAVAVEGAFAIDFLSSSAKIVANVSNAFADQVLNSCAGVSSPTYGTSYDVTNSNCATLAGTTSFTIARVDTSVNPNRLQLGEVAENDDPSTPSVDETQFDGSTLEKRNVILGETLIKQ
jgi:hypothetical protein